MNWQNDLAAREAEHDDYAPLTVSDPRLRRFDRGRRWRDFLVKLAAAVFVGGIVAIGLCLD